MAEIEAEVIKQRTSGIATVATSGCVKRCDMPPVRSSYYRRRHVLHELRG